jgi:hypothetical protein
MWIFTKHGFFSIVLDAADHSQASIRGRAIKDLEALQQAFPDLLGGYLVRLTPERDYYCRLTIPRAELPLLYAALAEAIDYPDFKTELKRTHAQDDKLPLLNNLWGTMNRYQNQVHPGMGLYNGYRGAAGPLLDFDTRDPALEGGRVRKRGTRRLL